MTNAGLLEIDAAFEDGGSQPNVDGTLNNSGSLQIGNSSLVNVVTATAGASTNSGYVAIAGGTDVQAALDVASAAGFLCDLIVFSEISSVEAIVLFGMPCATSFKTALDARSAEQCRCVVG